MRLRSCLAALLLAMATPAAAQDDTVIRPVLQLSAGAYLPRGNMSRDFAPAATLGAQARLELFDFMRGVVGVGWTQTQARFLASSNDVVHLWHYDAGLEFLSAQEAPDGWTWRPFAGAGVGGRSHDYRARGVGTVTCVTGYGALGSEAEAGGIVYRLEGRTYVSAFPAPATGRRELRTDFAIAFGLRRM